MTALIHPLANTRWNRSAASWAAYRQALQTWIYPSGIPTALASSVARNSGAFTKPTGCAQIDIMTIAEAGGRVGGTALYVNWLKPTAASNGKLAVMHCGHSSTGAPGWTTYYSVEAASIPVRLLALGYHVLMVESPGTGYQPIPQQIVVDGSPVTTAWTHGYWVLQDGGPNPMRMYLDHSIRAINQVCSEVTINKIVGAGHSGGFTVALVAICDSRMRRVAIAQGGTSWQENVGHNDYGDWEQMHENPMFLHVPDGDFPGIVGMAAAGGIPVWLANGDTDTTFPVRDWPSWRRWWAMRNEMLTPTGGIVTIYESAGDHGIPVQESIDMVAWLDL